MPSLSVRAFAEMLNLPAYEQARILLEQKYPRRQPQTFRIPFYAPALKAIRTYYHSGNDQTVLATARNEIAQLRLVSRREHNTRVLDQFERSDQADRSLQPTRGQRLVAHLGTVALRLAFDLTADEAGQRRYILYNPRTGSIDPGIARTTIEIAHWTLEQNALRVPLRSIEYVDIGTGRSHRTNRRRSGTIRRVRQNAKIIEALWPTI